MQYICIVIHIIYIYIYIVIYLHVYIYIYIYIIINIFHIMLWYIFIKYTWHITDVQYINQSNVNNILLS